VTAHGALVDRLEAIMKAAVPSVAPAVALCVRQNGETIVDIQAGCLDPDREKRALPADALFDLASLSKPFTSTAFLGFVSEGRVALDDAVVTLIPEFAASGPRDVNGGQEPLTRRMLPTPADRRGWLVDPTEVTFRQLLTHTSGLAPWRAIFRESGPVAPPPDRDDASSVEQRRRAGLAALCSYPFVARPGSEFHYSDLGFMALGEAVARLGEAPLDEVVRNRVTRSLGLDSVGYTPARSGIPMSRIVPTSFDDDWRMRRCWGEVEDENAAGLGGVAGHAGLFATVANVAAFGQAWLASDASLGLDADLVATATRDQTAALGASRGLGWQLRGRDADYLSPFSDDSFGHTGFTGTSLAIDPARGTVVALLTDRVFAGRTHAGIETLRVAIHEVCAELLA
jgi:serine-type D-Ala-D-Ala carboxypeptidase